MPPLQLPLIRLTRVFVRMRKAILFEREGMRGGRVVESSLHPESNTGSATFRVNLLDSTLLPCSPLLLRIPRPSFSVSPPPLRTKKPEALARGAQQLSAVRWIDKRDGGRSRG